VSNLDGLLKLYIKVGFDDNEHQCLCPKNA
jgi:hypothetical protein